MNNPPFTPGLPVPPCPVCGAGGHERMWSQYATHHMYAIQRMQASVPHILSPKNTVEGWEVKPLVCTRCGYVMNFVDPADFRES